MKGRSSDWRDNQACGSEAPAQEPQRDPEVQARMDEVLALDESMPPELAEKIATDVDVFEDWKEAVEGGERDEFELDDKDLEAMGYSGQEIDQILQGDEYITMGDLKAQTAEQSQQ
jgi:hypothetical protein